MPIADKIQAFDVLGNHAGVEEQVLDYFQTYYIGKLRRGRHLEPRYPHTLWNMNENLPRTSNDLEGWHNRFSSSFTHHHTHVWKFIDDLKEDSSLNHSLMAKMIAGASNPLQRCIYREVNERIQRLVVGYQKNDIIDFLTEHGQKLAPIM